MGNRACDCARAPPEPDIQQRALLPDEESHVSSEIPLKEPEPLIEAENALEIPLHLGTWTGHWALERRDNWSPYLTFLGMAEEAHSEAIAEPDFHEYEFREASFVMDHRIPGRGWHVRFTALIDGQFHASPYPLPTADEYEAIQWKHDWVTFPNFMKTTLSTVRKDKIVELHRELEDDETIKCTVQVLDAETHSPEVGPCFSWFKRTSYDPPATMMQQMSHLLSEGALHRTAGLFHFLHMDGLAKKLDEHIHSHEHDFVHHIHQDSWQGHWMFHSGAILELAHDSDQYHLWISRPDGHLVCHSVMKKGTGFYTGEFETKKGQLPARIRLQHGMVILNFRDVDNDWGRDMLATRPIGLAKDVPRVHADGKKDLEKKEGLEGVWSFPSGTVRLISVKNKTPEDTAHYRMRIKRLDGNLEGECFLEAEGRWYEGEISTAAGPLPTRLCLQGRDTILVNFQDAKDDHWGQDMVLHRAAVEFDDSDRELEDSTADDAPDQDASSMPMPPDEWAKAFDDHFFTHPVVQEEQGEYVNSLSAAEAKLLEIRTLLPVVKAKYESMPGALNANRSEALNRRRDDAENRRIAWRENIRLLHDRGAEVWERERTTLWRDIEIPSYYQVCYQGPFMLYELGYGEWMAAFDAPSEYVFSHMHYFPDMSPKDSGDALSKEFNNLALKHLAAATGHTLCCVDIGCGVGISTFSMARSLHSAHRVAQITGVDLSDYFVTLARYLHPSDKDHFAGTIAMDFIHGNALDLAASGFGDASLELVTVREVTQEMSKSAIESLFAEVARVLAPGGVLAYMDLNPQHNLNDREGIADLVENIVTNNQVYLDEYIDFDVAAAIREVGLEVVEETWPNKAHFREADLCDLRIVIARKPATPTLDTWTGRWHRDRHENWGPYLSFLGVPKSAHRYAMQFQDIHEYEFTADSFLMEHHIPERNWHVRFTGLIDGEWQRSPYPMPRKKDDAEEGNGSAYKKDTQDGKVTNAVKEKVRAGEVISALEVEQQREQQLEQQRLEQQKLKAEEQEVEKEETRCVEFKHEWVQFPTCVKTTMTERPESDGDKSVVVQRELESLDEIKCTVQVIDAATSEQLVGPCITTFRRVSREPPMDVVHDLRKVFATGITKGLKWRLQAIDRVAEMIVANVDAWSAAQVADNISPASFVGASAMLQLAAPYYKASLELWAAPEKREESGIATDQTRTPGDWEVVKQPKGVGLIISPCNANVMHCVLPLFGMLAAGNVCILKPSENAKHTSRLLSRLVPRYFPERAVAVVEGGKDTVERLIGAHVDHVVLTGGGDVARDVLANAAKRLIPCSLALGGKNPCFIDSADDDQLRLYAEEIIATKAYFSGQFCQAFDYCLVHEQVFDKFLDLMKAQIQSLGDKRHCRLVNAAHAQKVRELLAGQEHLLQPPLHNETEEPQHVEQNEHVDQNGEFSHKPSLLEKIEHAFVEAEHEVEHLLHLDHHRSEQNGQTRDLKQDEKKKAEEMCVVPLSLVVEPAWDSPLMSTEIFGPLLPILKVVDAQEAADIVQSRPKPLVCYCYSPDAATWSVFQEDTCSGNLAVNCGPQRMQSNFNVGLGGVGDSGYGCSIWGRAAFDEFSQHKTVFRGKEFSASSWGAPATSRLSASLAPPSKHSPSQEVPEDNKTTGAVSTNSNGGVPASYLV